MGDITRLSQEEMLRAERQASGDAFSVPVSTQKHHKAEGLLMTSTINGKPISETNCAEGENPPIQSTMHSGYDMETEAYDVTSGQKKNTLGKVGDAYNAGGAVIIMDSKYPQQPVDTAHADVIGAFLESGKTPDVPKPVTIKINPVVAVGVSFVFGAGAGLLLRRFTKMNPYAIIGVGLVAAASGVYLLTNYDNENKK